MQSYATYLSGNIRINPTGSDILHPIVHAFWKQYADSGKREISCSYLDSNIIYL